MPAVYHRRHINDTLPPLGLQLKRQNEAGTPEAVDLTGLDVKFKMVNSDGEDVVAETSTGVTVTDAEEGKVQYDFSEEDVAEAGEFYAYFVVYDGEESDTFPAVQREVVVVIYDD